MVMVLTLSVLAISIVAQHIDQYSTNYITIERSSDEYKH